VAISDSRSHRVCTGFPCQHPQSAPGGGRVGSPINVWADPVYWPFFSDDPLFATQASTLIAYVAVQLPSSCCLASGACLSARTSRVRFWNDGRQRGETAHWTGRMLAKAVGISLRSVQRILEAHQLAPHRIRTFKMSNDPKFADKLRDVVGLYVDPPAHAVVLTRPRCWPRSMSSTAPLSAAT
jgi:hypothetical protein